MAAGAHANDLIGSSLNRHPVDKQFDRHVPHLALVVAAMPHKTSWDPYSRASFRLPWLVTKSFLVIRRVATPLARPPAPDPQSGLIPARFTISPQTFCC